MIRKRNGILAGAAVVLAAGLGTGVALAASGGGPGSTGQPARAAGAPASLRAGAAPGYSGPGYSWYRSMMGSYYGGMGGMMGGGSGPGWMMSRAGYRWMTGGTGVPGWMRGGTLPGPMMGSGGDPGTVMGKLFAGAPGPRVSPVQARRLGSTAPAGAVVDRAARAITFTGHTVRLTVLASPSMPAESFRIGGMTNPALRVPAGAHVTITVINADDDMAHGLVITATGAGRSPMPMMSAPPAFPGAALWFLGEPTAAGMHEATLAFTATTPGTYRYLCPIPRHAQEGMIGTFTVR
ncbi:MAG: sulfocyanin-like copper-binding protein [Micromonosporaceae bacterium]